MQLVFLSLAVNSAVFKLLFIVVLDITCLCFFIVLCIVIYLCKMTEYITIRLSKENIHLSIIQYTEFKMLLVINIYICTGES